MGEREELQHVKKIFFAIQSISKSIIIPTEVVGSTVEENHYSWSFVDL